MFDIKWIRDDPEAFDAGLARRGLDPQSPALLALDQTRREAQTRAQELQTRRNELSKIIGRARAAGENTEAEIQEVASSKKEQAAAEDAAKARGVDLESALAELPNLPLEDVPDGADEEDNIEVRRWGEPKSFSFAPKEHFEIGEGLGMMDFETAAKMSGSRFCILSGALARLERSLGAFMLDLHTGEHGYTEVNPPALVRDDAAFGTGQLPKFEEDLFKTENGYWLIPTAEVPLTNMIAGEILEGRPTVSRFSAMTSCFRSEAGAAGRDTRGMIRQHQFSKVELVSVAHPDGSDSELGAGTNDKLR